MLLLADCRYKDVDYCGLGEEEKLQLGSKHIKMVYRDIERYINGAIIDQTTTLEVMRYSRWIGENNRICL